MLLTDDSAARKAAAALGRQVRGTLGIILMGMDAGLRTKRKVLNLLTNLRTRCSFHVKPSVLSSVIEQVR
jgi:predicted nucleic acid-binding protein